MKITQLMELLQRSLDAYGDKDVYYYDDNELFDFTYAGSGESTEMEYFWLSTQETLADVPDEQLQYFKVSSGKPELKLVK